MILKAERQKRYFFKLSIRMTFFPNPFRFNFLISSIGLEIIDVDSKN